MSKGITIWSVPFVALMVANFFQNIAAFVAHTTLPVYAHFLGASTSMVGVVSGGFAMSALLVRPFAGPAFDSFSRKRLLAVSLGIICIAFVLFGVVDGLGPLIAVRLFQGVGIGCAGPLAMSLVSEYLPPNRFSSGISIFTLSQSLAQIIGPALGLLLVDIADFSGAFLVSAGMLLVAILSLAFVREPCRKTLPYKLRLNRMFARAAIPATMTLMLLATSFSCTTAYVVLYGYSLGVDNLGLYFSIYAACLVLTRPLYGRLSDRYGAARLLLAGVVFFAASFVALHFANDFNGFALAAVLGSAGFGACGPLLQSLALAAVPVQHRGAASNTAYSGLDLGMLLGPTIGGAATEAFLGMTASQSTAYSDMWIVMLIPIAIASIVIVYWNVRARHRQT